MARRSSSMFRAAAWVAVALAPCGATASTVRPMNLEEMTERAARIFVGRCADVASAEHPAVRAGVTRSTFDVDEVLKGSPAARVSFRHIGTRRADGAPPGREFGIPRIDPGEEVVLFLYGESALGLSSPVGLGQGRFTIFRGKDGRRYVQNDAGNRPLLRGLSPKARARIGEAAERPLPSPLPLDTLLEMVRKLRGNGEARGDRR